MGYRSDVALKFVRTDLEDYHINAREADAPEFYTRYQNEMRYRSLVMEQHVDSLISDPEDGSLLPLPIGLLSLLQNSLRAEIHLDSKYVTALITHVKWYDTYPPIQAVMSLLVALDSQDMHLYYGYCRFGEDMEDQDHEGWIQDRPYVSREIDLQTSKDAKIVNY
tara:strand:- start:185 stop:679 length:495 start_codon:yes stop_codon:yes gene_type:complete